MECWPEVPQFDAGYAWSPLVEFSGIKNGFGDEIFWEKNKRMGNARLRGSLFSVEQKEKDGKF